MSGFGNRHISGLRWSLGENYYQFFGSAEKLYRDYLDTTSPYYASRYSQRGFVTAVSARKNEGQTILSARPIVSSLEYPPTEGQWAVAFSPYELDEKSLFVPSHQPDGVGLRDAYFDEDRQVLSCAYGQAAQCTSFGEVSGANSWSINHEDYGYDFSVNHFRRSRKAKASAPDSDFYRTAGLQKVVSEVYGTRYFIIMHDVNQRFYAYPLKVYGDIIPEVGYPDIKTNVPESLVQSQDVPWPDWVNLPEVGRGAGLPIPDDYFRRPKSLWVFSPDGTKAVTIANHRQDAWANNDFISSGYYNVTGEFLNYLQDDVPGLVEVQLQILLTGNDDRDFTFTISLGRTVYALTDAHAPLVAAYAVADIGSVQKGDLLMLTYENYVDQPSLTNGELLQRPTIAAIAKVYVHQTDWVLVREWLALYSCFATDAHEPLLFNPKLVDLSEVQNYGTLDRVESNHFFYSTQINAIDLGSLSFNLSPMVWTSGSTYYTNPTKSTSAYLNAASIRVYAFNELIEQKEIGYPLLKIELNNLFTLQSFNAEAFTKVAINAVISMEETVEEGEVMGTSAVLTGIDGTQTSLTNYRREETFNFSNVPVFPNNSRIYQPIVFKYFDSYAVVRPGFQSSDQQQTSVTPATCSFSNYPVGVILLNKAYLTTLTAHDNPQYRMTVSPNQSIAYFYGPIMARKSVWFRNEAAFDDLEQTHVDKIRFKVNNEFVESSHLDCFNQAFGKELTTTSYNFTIQPNIPNRSAIQWKPNTVDISEYNWMLLTTDPPIGINWTIQFLVAGWAFVRSTLPDSFVGNPRYTTWSPFGVFPNPKIEGKWGVA